MLYLFALPEKVEEDLGGLTGGKITSVLHVAKYLLKKVTKVWKNYFDPIILDAGKTVKTQGMHCSLR